MPEEKCLCLDDVALCASRRNRAQSRQSVSRHPADHFLEARKRYIGVMYRDAQSSTIGTIGATGVQRHSIHVI